MGYNHWHRTAYYANLNLNTTQTFPQHRAVEITRRLILGLKTGRNPEEMFGELGIFTPRDYSYQALIQEVAFSARSALPVTQNTATLLGVMDMEQRVWRIKRALRVNSALEAGLAMVFLSAGKAVAAVFDEE